MPPSWKALLAADTDHTLEYVFESSRLPEIRGASRKLTKLNDWAAQKVADRGGAVILKGGGNLLALVPLDEAEELARVIEAQFPIETKTATITVAWRPVSEEMVSNGYPANGSAPFGSLIRWAGSWLRQRKDSRDAIPWTETLPFAERCRSCQIRPADPDFLPNFPDWPLCRVCFEKRTHIGRDHWFQYFQDFLSKDPIAYEKYYQGSPAFPGLDREQQRAYWTPHDLGEIGQACRSRRGYVGMIYLDGDEMGQVFNKVDTQETAQRLSEALQHNAEQGVMQTLAEYLNPTWVQPSDARQKEEKPPEHERDQGGRIRIHPFEILTIGGDDILLIVPADQAIPIACAITKRFQDSMKLVQNDSTKKGSQDANTWQFSLSGGVVLADDHNPVRALRDLAGELKSSAKQARHKEGAKEGYLDFLVLLGTDMPDRSLKKSRLLYPYLIDQPGFPPISLLARPYPAARLGEAWVELQELKGDGFSNSQMTLLVESLLKGIQESRLYYLTQRQRGDNFKHLDAALQVLQGSGFSANYPWFEFEKDKPSPLRARTALWDLAELYSLVATPG